MGRSTASIRGPGGRPRNRPATATARPHDERPEEHHPRHRALGPGVHRLAVLLRAAADGKAETGGPAADPAAAEPAAAARARRVAPAGARAGAGDGPGSGTVARRRA